MYKQDEIITLMTEPGGFFRSPTFRSFRRDKVKVTQPVINSFCSCSAASPQVLQAVELDNGEIINGYGYI